MSARRFDRKVAIVTGGGTGIGAATARRIAAEGGKVVVTGRRREPLDRVAQETGGAALAGDAADFEHLQNVVALAVDRFGGVDILVANAGIALPGMVEDLDLEDWHRSIAVNLDGPLLATRAVVPEMRRRGGGSIVHVASVAALKSGAGITPYVTSKTALLGLNRSIACELGPENIRSNVVCPAFVRTEMSEGGFGHAAAQAGMTLEEVIAKMVRMYPLRRGGEPGEIAAAIAFLASDDASFVTGTVLEVDGGSGIVEVGATCFL
jgi:meso-butanediol dehydrogenase/(S,S)-butanediol dehydrogenase/diacetyl reductase